MTRPLLTGTFWLDTLERTIRTAAQALLGAITASQVALDELDWQLVGLSLRFGADRLLRAQTLDPEATVPEARTTFVPATSR